MTSACDYLRLYRARSRGGYVHGMVAPWRHENPLVRALYHKQEMWAAEREIIDCGKQPSAELDEAVDRFDDRALKWEEIIQHAWLTRAMSRGTIPAKQREPEAA